MTHSTVELVLQDKIRQLEYELSIFRHRESPNFLKESMDLDELVTNPSIQIPLWGFQETVTKDLKLIVTTRTADGFALYADSLNHFSSIYEEAKLLDILQQKTQSAYIKHLKTKYKSNSER